MWKWLFVFYISAICAEAKSTICLNMIVKNEAPIIERSLNAVKGMIDYWVIVDTGSEDGTQDLIRKTLKDIPGKLYERPWVNFGHNRQEALEFAKGTADYALFIDADEQMVKGTIPDQLDLDYYFIDFEDEGYKFSKILLINLHRDWAWNGVIHEQLVSDTATSHKTLPDLLCLRHTSSSARSQDPKKYYKDAKILEEELKKDPTNSRNVFYLAQSYANAHEERLALKFYEQRSQMGGWDQEIFWSLLNVAMLQDQLKFPATVVTSSYNKAFMYKPDRAEPLFHLSRYLIKEGQIGIAYSLCKLASGFCLPTEHGYRDPSIYEYGIKMLLAITAYELGKIEEAREFTKRVSEVETLPKEAKKSLELLTQLIEKKPS